MENGELAGTRYDSKVYSDGVLGFITTVTVVLLVWGYCWLKNYSGLRIPQMINVVFNQVAGLNTNASVFVDGVRVGIVDKIEWEDKSRVLVKVRINNTKVTVPKGSRFEIHTNGIVGARFVEIILPDDYENAEPLDAGTIVKGEDPVRPELAVNKLAIGLSQIDMEELHNNFEADRKRLVRAADELSALAQKTMPIVEKALPLEEQLLVLTKEVRVSLNKINVILGDSHVSEDVKAAAKEARETVETVKRIVDEINSTIKDKKIRHDLLDSVKRLSEASQSVERSVDKIEKIADNKEIRDDIKSILKDARVALTKADKLLKNKQFTRDIGTTIAKTNETLDELDDVAKRLNKILDSRFPLPKMIFGRPGHLKNEKAGSKDKVKLERIKINKQGEVK